MNAHDDGTQDDASTPGALVSEIVRMAELLKKWDEDHPESDYVVLPQAFGPKISFAGSNLLINGDDIVDLILSEIDSHSTHRPEYDSLTTGFSNRFQN